MTGPYWTDQWNPVTGCTSVSEGCEHCWARGMRQRFHPEPFSDVRERPERLDKPLHWRKPKTIFVCNTAVENQQRANERIPILRKTPAAHRWVSAEPLLEGIDFRDIGMGHQVVVGGESGAGARPCDVEWIRDIVLQSNMLHSRPKVFVKQLGSNAVDTDEHGKLGLQLRNSHGADPAEWPEDLRVRELGWGR